MSARPSRKSRQKSDAAAVVVAVSEPEPVAPRAESVRAGDADEAAAVPHVGPADAAVQTGEHPVPRSEDAAEAEADAAGEGSDDPQQAAAPELDRERAKSLLESLVFVAEGTVTAAQLGRMIKVRAAVVRALMAELMTEYEPRGIALVEVGSGYQFRSAARNAEIVREYVAQRPVRLTRAQLETLALIAYRQPITRPEIDEVRGVDSGSAMRVLLERELIKLLGRKDEPGRPLLYGTTPYFLEFFGLKALKELPTLREFTELSEENRALFKRKTGEEVGDAEAALAAAEEAARYDDEPGAHISDEDLAALAAREDAEREGEGEGARPPEPDADAVDAQG